MNSNIIDKTMNSTIELTDGEITISNGIINFSDETILQSSADIAFKSLNNNFSGENSFSGITNTESLVVSGVLDVNAAVNIDGIVKIFNNSGSDGYGFGALQLTQGGLYAHEISCFNKQIIVNDEIRGSYMSLNSTTGSISSTTGALVVSGGVGIEGNVVSNTAFCIPNDFYGTSYISNGIHEGLYRGNGDGATSTTQNLKIKSWNGIGFIYSNTTANPTQEASIYMDVRSGVLTNNYSIINQTVSVGGLASLNGGVTVTGLIRTTNTADNKKLVLYDLNMTEAVSTAVSFYGFGINSGALRYQANSSSNYHRFYCGSVLNLEVGNNMVEIPTSTASSSTTTGALVVTGGVGIAGSLYIGGITKITDTTSSSSSTTGALVVSGGVGIDKNLKIGGTAEATSGGLGSITTVGGIYATKKILSSSIIEGIAGLNINNKVVFYRSLTGSANKVLMEPLYNFFIAVVNNTTYTLNLLAQGITHYLNSPYNIRIMFYPSGSQYPVHDITGQNFNTSYSNGWGLCYTDENTIKIRTGSSNVALIYNHTTLAYQSYNSGNYEVFIYP